MTGTTITKSQFIRASECLPKLPNEGILSAPCQERARDRIKAYEASGGFGWNYDDLPNIMRDLFRCADTEAFFREFCSGMKSDEAKAKELILRFIAKELPPVDFEIVEVTAPSIALAENVLFRRPFDTVLRSDIGFHWVFVLPQAAVRLQSKQFDLMMNVLSQPVQGYDEPCYVEFFEFPTIQKRREPKHIRKLVDYGNVELADQTLEHYRRFHVETLRARGVHDQSSFDI